MPRMTWLKIDDDHDMLGVDDDAYAMHMINATITLGCYNRLSEYLMKKGFMNNEDCPCVFIRKSNKGFCIVSVYVDDLNIIGTNKGY